MRRTLSSYAATILLFAITLTPHGAAAGSCICFSCAFNPKLENFRASSAAMAPTMMTGDCATMRHIDPQTDQVQRGDIIGFTHPMQPATFVFRVMAIAGDRIQLKDGGVVLNGHPLPQEVLSEDISTVPTTPPFPRCAERPAIPGKAAPAFGCAKPCHQARATRSGISGRSGLTPPPNSLFQRSMFLSWGTIAITPQTVASLKPPPDPA